MSFNIEWTNADALTPNPVTVIRDGCHVEVKLDAHYVSDEEVETVRRYIATLKAENAKLRELVRIAGTYCVNGMCGKDDGCPLYLGKPYCALHDRMREAGVEV